ncbi:MAG: methyltransferase [Cytophagales bacterium]|nr:MAG: methyltransferase [Cytophagales bacterium]
MHHKDKAKEIIIQLVERFRENVENYKKNNYNEAQTRIDFINPFFEALGWDINNSAGAAESYREVVHEDRIKIEGKTKAPDYCFTLKGSRKFFLEAKKPKIFIKEEMEPAFQVRRYGWSAKLPLSIITDFEEFSIYDCTKKPKNTDSARIARLKYIHYTEYEKEFDFIWNLFSKEAVINGSIENFIASDKSQKGTDSVDTDFLASLDQWRDYLAKAILTGNKKLDEEQLNFVLQRTLDRIIFLRICEDRGVERYGKMREMLKGQVYQNLFDYFQEANNKYNSGLFDFQKDTLSKNIHIDNKVLKNIIEDLYYPKSPYEFSVIPVEILGDAYEQFLGKIIRITPNQSIRIEEKPEVRKAGGVYYTPQYIVEYIVSQTVGKMIEGKTPEEIATIKICDPACGSGSFLLGAYKYLLDYHHDYYTQLKKKPKNTLTPEGNLTTSIKKQILLNNIHGVDLDINAVEVTKLSLMLKAMEGETEASIKSMISFFHERVLPTLDDNIKSGNSLIDIDFYDGQIDFSPQEEKKVKPFNWQTKFPEIFKQGGFDIVIGNPPYVKIQTISENQPVEVLKYLKRKYLSGKSGNFDLYVVFTEKGYQLLNQNGLMGFIQPHKFFQADFGDAIRNFLASKKALQKVVHFGAEQIFGSATTYTCLLFLSRQEMQTFDFEQVTKPLDWAKNKNISYNYKIAQPKIGQKWNFANSEKQNILDKIYQQPQTLGDITRKIFVGLQTSADNIYVLKIIEERETTYYCYSASLEQNIEIEKKLVKPFLMGKDVKRYEKPIFKNVVIFPYTIVDGKAVLMTQKYIKEVHPMGWKYILSNRKKLENRENGKMKNENFYAYIYPKNLAEFDFAKISTPYLANQPEFTYDKEKLYHTTKVYSLGFKDGLKENERYFLGILNSKIFWFFINNISSVFRGGYFVFATEFIKPFPIKLIDFKNKDEKKLHDDIVKSVDIILQNKERILLETNIANKELLQDHINYYEYQIDQYVFQLYQLTEEEIQTINENT